jgi:hypothetical protein
VCRKYPNQFLHTAQEKEVIKANDMSSFRGYSLEILWMGYVTQDVLYRDSGQGKEPEQPRFIHTVQSN